MFGSQVYDLCGFWGPRQLIWFPRLAVDSKWFEMPVIGNSSYSPQLSVYMIIQGLLDFETGAYLWVGRYMCMFEAQGEESKDEM